MYNIFIKTSLYKNSNFLPHLLEHCMLPKIDNSKNYFKNMIFSGDNYTYYTNFTLKTDSEKKLNDYLNMLTNTKLIEENRVKYETKIIKDESNTLNYTKQIINKIGQKLYGKDFKYSKVIKITQKEIIDYHKKYYSRENIIILEKDFKEKDIDLGRKINNVETFELKIGKNKEKIFLFDYKPEFLFCVHLLSQLFDEYIKYTDRYNNGKYYSNDTISGEFEDKIFLVINSEDLNKVMNIPTDFVKNFINYKLKKFDKKDYIDIDGPLMLKYGYTISTKSKKKMISDLENILKLIG